MTLRILFQISFGNVTLHSPVRVFCYCRLDATADLATVQSYLAIRINPFKGLAYVRVFAGDALPAAGTAVSIGPPPSPVPAKPSCRTFALHAADSLMQENVSSVVDAGVDK